MSKIGLWKNIFGHREKVAVDVGGKTELLTETQSYRFSEISEQQDAPPGPSYSNPLEDIRYKLSDAAFRLMISEDEVLAKHGRAIVRTLDLCRTNDDSQTGLDGNTLANLRAWGAGEKQFFPLHPLTIERNMVVLLPPL